MEKVMETAMERAEFEKKFLTLVNQTDVVITAPNIAYHLSIPIEEAQDHLLALELNGTLQEAMDAQGNSYYMMPNRPAPGMLPALSTLQNEPNAGALQPGVHNPADLRAAPIYSKPGAPGMNINGMVLNAILPGVGSLMCGHKNGLAMMSLLVLGIIVFFLPLGFGRLLGLLPIAIGWIWSIAAGLSLLNEKERGPGVPS